MTTLLLLNPVATVTSWPREGVALLIIIVLLLAIVTVMVNRRNGVALAKGPRADLITPPIPEDDEKEMELHDV